MPRIVDLRKKKVGDLAPGGAAVDLCPKCGKPGLWLNPSGTNPRESYAHVVDSVAFEVLEGCFLDIGGKA